MSRLFTVIPAEASRHIKLPESLTLTGCDSYTQPNKKKKKNMHHGLKMALGKSNLILKLMGVGTLPVVYVQHVWMKVIIL